MIQRFIYDFKTKLLLNDLHSGQNTNFVYKSPPAFFMDNFSHKSGLYKYLLYKDPYKLKITYLKTSIITQEQELEIFHNSRI